jgi:hypothetical protein
MTSAAAPELSVVLVTPFGFEPMRRLIGYLALQDVRDRIEIVVVATSRAELALDQSALAGFWGYQVVEFGPIDSLNRPRVAGIRAARAPIVAMSEDHCFPAPGWARALLEAHREAWAAVGPTVALANPESARAWANYLIQYGGWVQPDPGGEIDDLPGHNSSYKRELLLAYGERLESMMVADTMLHWDLRRRGFKLRLEPRAVSHHVFMTLQRPFLAENFYIGWQFAGIRARSCGLARRLLFLSGSPLLPAVRLRRIVRRMRQFGWQRDLLPRALPALLLGLAASAAGELCGYALGLRNAMSKTVDLDFRRDRFVSTAERERLFAGELVRFPATPAHPSQLARARGAGPAVAPGGTGQAPPR